MERRFSVLHVAVGLMKIAAWIALVIIVLVGIMVIVRVDQLPPSDIAQRQTMLLTGFGVIAVGILTWVSGMIVPELIEVLLAIEENTRPAHTATAKMAAQ